MFFFFQIDTPMNEPAFEVWIQSFDTEGRWHNQVNENQTCEKEPQTVGKRYYMHRVETKTIKLLTTSSTWMTKSRNLQSEAEEGWV